jgi:hypothetical protein
LFEEEKSKRKLEKSDENNNKKTRVDVDAVNSESQQANNVQSSNTAESNGDDAKPQKDSWRSEFTRIRQEYKANMKAKPVELTEQVNKASHFN